MKFKEALTENLIVEQEGHNSLLLLDVDDTLVKAKGIYVYLKYPDGSEEKISPEEFAKRSFEKDKQKGIEYDFRDFQDPQKVASSIKTGLPIVSNLRLMDSYISNGWKVGILTARGMEDTMTDVMQSWLKFRDSKGELKNIGPKLVRDLVHAVNDSSKKYPGGSSFEKKLNVIKKLAKKYDRVYFVDDDENNLNAVRDWIENNNIQNVAVKQAKA